MREYTDNHIGHVITQAVRNQFSAFRSNRVTLDNFYKLNDEYVFKFNYRTPTRRNIKFSVSSIEVVDYIFINYCKNRNIKCYDFYKPYRDFVKYVEALAGVHHENTNY